MVALQIEKYTEYLKKREEYLSAMKVAVDEIVSVLIAQNAGKSYRELKKEAEEFLFKNKVDMAANRAVNEALDLYFCNDLKIPAQN